LIQNEPSDDEIIPLLLAGDESAYHRVVSAYHGMMVNMARNIVGESIADEVAQEAWVSVMRALPKFERRSSLKTWILRIVSNSAKSRLRRESRTINLEDPLDESVPMISESHFDARGHWQAPPNVWSASTPEEILASDQLQSIINNTVNDLPPMQRTVLILREMQGQDMETICKILEVSESNARVLLHRARSQIREAIDNYYGK
jgi:RNA polymerase sigma-70 factor (ECF subfamily)